MELVAIKDGQITLRVHWTVAQIIAQALQGKESAEDEIQVEMLATLFESATMAANLQVATSETEKMTLAWLRETGGDRVAAAS